MNKISNINKYRNEKSKYKKMLLISILSGLFIGLFVWKYFVENIANYDVKIPQSNNIKYNESDVESMNTKDLITFFENNDNKPILLYFYTTWCGVCNKNFPVFNEIAREFQNTDLKLLAIAIDRDIDQNKLKNHLNNLGDLYFPMKYLTSKEGFAEFLNTQNIKYNGYIPFTILIDPRNKSIIKYNGYKNKNYLRNNIIKILYPN